MKAILEQIAEAMDQEGSLPVGFSLKRREIEGGLKFAPGAEDGILLFHTPEVKLEGTDADKLFEIIKTISSGRYEDADDMISHFSGKYAAIKIYSDLRKMILEHLPSLEQNNLYKYSYIRLGLSQDRDVLKYAMMLLSLFKEPKEDIKNTVRIVGTYDEFTYFAVLNALRWSNSEEEIYSLAKRTQGWGRIHAIAHLKGEREDIRKWLLHTGRKNNVMNQYTALAVYKMTKVEERLETCDAEELKDIIELVEDLAKEGPVEGISAIDKVGLLGSQIARAIDRVGIENEWKDRLIEALR